MKARLTRKLQVRMPPSPPISMSSSCSSLGSTESKKKRRASQKKAARHVIYVARIDHLHYTPPSRGPAQCLRQPSAPRIDPKTLTWGEWFRYQCNQFAWVGQAALAVIIFIASRVSLGFGVRLNGGDA